MSPTVISVEHLSKSYRLGQIGTGTFTNDLQLWWAKMRGKPNPLLRIGEADHGNRDGENLWALRDVSFTVEQGEVLGIIGRNGAGKSTLLKILSRVTAPTSGRIRVKGRVASLLEVGTGFHPELTGRENIYLNGAILGMSKAEVTRKFDEIVDFAEVEKFIETPVKRYSSGMYVRLAFAVAAHLDPEILVVDEVLAVGDAEFQKKCLGKMGDVAKEGRTVLFVSHNLEAVSVLTQRAIFIEYGKLKLSGSSVSVINQYLAVSEYGNKNQDTPLYFSDEVELLGFLVCGQENENHLTVNQEICVEMLVKIKETLPSLSIGFDMVNSRGILFFRTYQDDFGLSGSFTPGVYKLVCKIPPIPLSSGAYFFNFRTGIRGIRHLGSVEKVAGFQLLPNLQEQYKRLPGIISPKIDWQVIEL